MAYQEWAETDSDQAVEYLTTLASRGSLVDTIETVFTLQPIPTAPLPSPTSGIVTAVHLQEGATLEAGFTPLLEVSGVTVWAMTSEVPLYRDLAYGVDGPDVAALQEALLAAGYDPGEIDGRFRGGTQYALERWQTDQTLDVTGTLLLTSVVRVEEKLRVGRILVEMGSEAVTGSPIAELVQPVSLPLATADVSQFEVLRVKSGQQVSLVFDADPTRTISATLGEMAVTSYVQSSGSETDSSGGSLVRFPITIVPSSLPDGLLPGMTGTASLVVASREDVVFVPVAAIGGTAEAPTVQVVTSSGIEERPVVVGLITTTSAEIMTGLVEGEEVMIGIADPTATATTIVEEGSESGGGPPPGVGGPP